MADFPQGFLASSAPVINPDGTLTTEFRTFLQNLWERTGGGAGSDIDAIAAVAAAAAAAAAASLKKLQNLSDVDDVPTSRNNLGLGSLALGDTVSGWSTPSGAGSRAAIDMNWTTAVGAGYVQSQVIAIRDQVIAMQKALGQLIIDAETATVIGP